MSVVDSKLRTRTKWKLSTRTVSSSTTVDMNVLTIASTLSSTLVRLVPQGFSVKTIIVLLALRGGPALRNAAGKGSFLSRESMDLNVKRVITPCGPLTNIRGEISSDLDRTKKKMENQNIIQTRSSWLNCALRD